MTTTIGAGLNSVLIEARGPVLLVTLNRPEARNAIDGALAHGLAVAVAQLDDDPELAVGVLTGAGRGFCAGMDLKAFRRREDISPLVAYLRNGSRKPMIAAVEGFALAGGLELALACDLVVAAEGARFGIPEVTVGLFAAGGGLLRLPGRVGYGTAMEMAITGDPITAERAHAAGLVARVTEPGGAVAEALRLAEQVARNAPLAVATSKGLLRTAQSTSEVDFWTRQRSLETAVFTSDDAKEGARAFAEKRPPRWTGT
ncbi:crotonase/enoyl-CoA hydratase family protein [Pseudonocardia sp. GCM10023141]|uniref:crotonase/enoyl-CoA hydratase family protein n=1 Tax=Pseudonocardia sp. GCM10023141 TaxID=3252653 RepID=UPI0036106270